MPDLLDAAQELSELTLANQIAKARPQQCGPSAYICEVCDDQIPPARRALIPGVTRCVTCQEIHEAKSRHIKG
ncbi:TraR/DksA family transcriptional regulator [Serratia rubidaea]|uniref:TraR/DksA family transcriptional regulator n=1 Tax=Serratia rubidaea TaxID=61652 RepID=UPI001F17D24F|nr:TraR/DksA family transcriptional regulator [Serratia rubidaea]UJD79839.1 TraR/DksA family transcriptional regulator [Serratia rubidaea]UJD84395.1 TraR/DksA family transcriptional regulator [Serratia rubidaea]